MTEIITDFINNIGSFGPVIACILIVLESMIPILPLCVFIVINFLAFGNIIGLLISWIFTVIGCVISFWLVRNGFQGIFNKKIRKNEKINSLMKKIDKWKLKDIVVIIAIPFTPAFAINIAAGLSNINFKKYLTALLLGKIFMVYFWGYVGVSFVECLANPMAIFKIVIMVLSAYFISNFVSKKFNLD